MYINMGFVSRRRVFSIFDAPILALKCSAQKTNGGILAPLRICSDKRNYFATLVSSEFPLKDNPARSYLIKREAPVTLESNETINKSVIARIEELAEGSKHRLDSYLQEVNIRDRPREFIYTSHRYPKVSSSADGQINLALTNNDLAMNHMREARLLNDDKHLYNRKITPSVHILTKQKHRFRPEGDRRLADKNLITAQEIFDGNVSNILKGLNPKSSITLLRNLSSLELKVAYGNLCKLLESASPLMSTLSISQLVELAVSVRPYVDSNDSYLRFHLLNIGAVLENKIQVQQPESEDLISYLVPLASMQFAEDPTTWSVLSNGDVLDKITDDFQALPNSSKASLLVILSSLEACPDLSNRYYRVYESLVNTLKSTLSSLEPIDVMNLINMPIIFSNLQLFREDLFNNTFERWKEFPLDSLAYLYLKRKDEISRECSDKFLRRFGRNVNSIASEYLPDLYCTYLKRGQLSSNQTKAYERALSLNYKGLSVKNISNMLMYMSISGTSRSRLYPAIIQRFQWLKSERMVSNQELLDVVLSMSLVGIHNINVWTDVEMANLVYKTPKNILVYLGYSFLITNQEDPKLWKVILERILVENRHFTSETYEVLTAARILGLLPNENNPRLNFLLHQCRPIYLTKMHKQRFRSAVPYEKMFDLMKVKYKKDVIISDLYEATFLLPEFATIVETTRDATRHPTSGSTTGEAMLRHQVWNKLNYRTFTFRDEFWDRFKNEDENGVQWDVEGMRDSFCKYTRLYHLMEGRGVKRDSILELKTRDQGGRVLLRSSPSSTEHSSKIRRLQSIIAQESKEA